MKGNLNLAAYSDALVGDEAIREQNEMVNNYQPHDQTRNLTLDQPTNTVSLSTLKPSPFIVIHPHTAERKMLF